MILLIHRLECEDAGTEPKFKFHYDSINSRSENI